uniref:Uncharacterized protein n=1 Tax=Gopherus agassizii TaxID=38772 RepID=A0A452HVR0_9SAUR
MRTNQLIKYTLFVSCYLFWVASGLMVAVGIYAKLSKEASAVDSLLADPSLILLTVGILMFGITFVGCTGALRDLPVLLKIFAWILLIILILQIVAAVLGFLFSSMVTAKPTPKLVDTAELDSCIWQYSCMSTDLEVSNTLCSLGQVSAPS